MVLFPFAAVGFGLLAAGQIKQGIDQAASLRATAKQLRREARLLLKEGKKETENVRKLSERNQAEIVALVSASGQEGGSALNAIVDQSVEDERQALTILFSSRAQAAILKKRARQFDKAAGGAIFGGLLAAGGSLLQLGASSGGGRRDTGGTDTGGSLG